MSETKDGIAYEEDEIDGEKVYYHPNSAEGKALRRLSDPINEDDYITVFDPKTDTFDAEELHARLIERGYTVRHPKSSVSED